MIISEQWLREWVSLDQNVQEIADTLTHAGLEVDGIERLPGEIENLVIGEVLAVSKHPNADRLNLTEVSVGDETLQIVCGASNVAAGLKVAVAMVGAKLPNGLKIKKAKVRDIESNGMLCSAAELGLEEHSEGILELAENAQIGHRVDQYLGLDDALIDIDLTPNRGDCLSIQGIARELKFLADGEYLTRDTSDVTVSSDATVAIELQDEVACPRYLGRVVTGIDPQAKTPLWMGERLRRCGVRPISPVVDITNYVMLELGQPMHAFDRAKINGGIVVRKAQQGETITLLDESSVELDTSTLVIADHQVPVAIAGVMGGADSAIGASTTEIILEAAHFTRKSAAGCARRYGLHTESSHRFERGVDPQLPARAMQRATELVLQICGGEAGPVCDQSVQEHLQGKPPVELRLSRLQQLLGMSLERGEVSRILQRIADQIQDSTTGWRVTPPTYRFDIEYEADLVEEVARVKGYDSIPTAIPRVAPRSVTGSEAATSTRRIRDTLVARDFHEVVTYSFISPDKLSQWSDETPVALKNPLAENLSVMRTSLLPGLIEAARFNLNRQRSRLRLFEIGASYHHTPAGHEGGANKRFVERQKLAAMISGPAHPQQWAKDSGRASDFYDLKADLEALLSLTGQKQPFIFNEFEHIATHPGQVSSVTLGERNVGFIGRLHPQLEQSLDFTSAVFVFELDMALAFQAELPQFQTVSKFPSVRRDLSIVVASDTPVATLLDTVKGSLGPSLSRAWVFDVYQGPGVEKGQKSVSLGLSFREPSRTLTDEDAEHLVSVALSAMKKNCGAELRK